MKKRTVITTEKREVWIISDGSVRPEVGNESDDLLPGNEEMLTPDQDEQDQVPTEEKECGTLSVR